MQLSEIIEQQANFVRDSNYSVTVNTLYAHVSIECLDEEAEDHVSIFLQNENADDFITEVGRLWNEVETVGYGTVTYAVAKPWIESIQS